MVATELLQGDHKEVGEFAPTINTLEDLKACLTQYGIDFSQWGITSGSKPIERLFLEIQKGDAELYVTSEGKLVRRIEQVGAYLYTQNEDGETFLLREEKQVFNDGRERRRKLGGASFREKLEVKIEGYNAALLRGLKEELPEIFAIQNEDISLIPRYPFFRIDMEVIKHVVDEESNYVPSFPGLENHSREYHYTWLIDPRAYSSDGYQSKEKDKTTYFIWEKVEINDPHLPLTSWQRLTKAQKEQAIKVWENFSMTEEMSAEVIAEYFFILERLQQIAQHNLGLIDYGSPLEIEHAANCFRQLNMEKDFPYLLKIKL